MTMFDASRQGGELSASFAVVSVVEVAYRRVPDDTRSRRRRAEPAEPFSGKPRAGLAPAGKRTAK